MAWTRRLWATAAVVAVMVAAGGAFALGPGAIGGQRYRVLISTDLGGSDEDDIQSMVHYLIYSDLFDTEGLVSSPPGKGRAGDILKVVDTYERDYPTLNRASRHYPSPGALRAMVKQGATEPAPDRGYSQTTEGSEWIVRCAGQPDERPLYVLVWGSITDVAQALHDAPGIKDKIRVYFIASWNQRNDEAAFAYLDREHPDMWLIHCNTTFRGWYVGGEQGSDLGNRAFVNEHVKGHGALGDFFVPLKGGSIKMGDTPSVAFLLRGTPDDPTQDSWGGRFISRAGRVRWWVDDPHPDTAEGQYAGARTVNQWRVDYLRDWAERMKPLKTE